MSNATPLSLPERVRELARDISQAVGYDCNVGDADAVTAVFDRIHMKWMPNSLIKQNFNYYYLLFFDTDHRAKCQRNTRYTARVLYLAAHGTAPRL